MTGSVKDNVTLGFAYGGVTLYCIIYSLTIAKYLYNTTGPVLPMFGYIFLFSAIYHMIRTTFTDPGVIPRGNLESAEQAMEAGIQIETETNDSELLNDKLEDSGDGNIALEMPIKKKEKLDISLYKHRYCTTCKIMRPPKASHCSDCDNCVQNFDHHCYFVGNCIGRRNHKYFFYFLFFAALFCLFTLISSLSGFCSVVSSHSDLSIKLGNKLLYWITAGCFLLTGLICCQPRYMAGIRYTVLGIGLFIGMLGLIGASSGLDIPYYEAPAVFIGYVISLIPFSLWIVSTCGGSLWGISVGLTVKEKTVIEREVDYLRRKGVFQIPFKEKIRNIKDFLSRKYTESHIHGVC